MPPVAPVPDVESAAVVESPEPLPPRPRRRWVAPLLWVLVLCLLAAAALTGGWYLGNGRFATTPPLVGLTEQAATDSLVAAGFRVAVEPEQRFSEEVAAGLVLTQTPVPGNEVRKGSTVSLALSRGPDRRVLPQLVGTTQQQATAALAGVGLAVGAVTQQFSSRETGTVLATDPPAEAQLPPGSPVALVVSKGVEMLSVPAVQGKPRGVAEKALADAGFKTVTTEVFNETAEKGLVIEQSPASGKAARGSTVTLRVSKGPELITIPDVTGQGRKEAEEALAALGLTTRVFAIPGPGQVRSTDPAAGQQVRKGASVTVYVF